MFSSQRNLSELSKSLRQSTDKFKSIAATLDIIRKKKKKVKKNITFVNTVKSGESKHNIYVGLGILTTATDWQYTADIIFSSV